MGVQHHHEGNNKIDKPIKGISKRSEEGKYLMLR